MPNYRRATVAGGTYFFAVAMNRRSGNGGIGNIKFVMMPIFGGTSIMFIGTR